MTKKHPRRVPLQLKLTLALFVIVMTPLAVSAYLIGQIGKVSANFVANEAKSRTVAIDLQARVYHQLVETQKQLIDEIADRLAKRADLSSADARTPLEPLLEKEAGLRAITIMGADGSVVARAERPQSVVGLRDAHAERTLAGGAKLQLTFEVVETQQQLAQLKEQLDLAKEAVNVRDALPDSYRFTFLIVLGCAGLVAAGFGIWASTRVTRRIAALVSTARSVSEGRIDARVELRGADEMAELGSAFNTMLDDLGSTRQQIEYLQRMGVWQDVARRLAHEIKNPLTPIQLAVQQCVSSYKGSDTDVARFTKLLADTGEIVGEEIQGLRRLVDTFRTLGALPRVEKAPLSLGDVIEELKLDPAMATRLTLVPPAEPVTVRADKLLLKRVLANLVENGIHAGQEAGTPGDVVIGWTTDPRDDVVTITVDDHGKGVSEANRDKIFEPYVTTKATGTGLGLAIARKLAIEHGGELAVSHDRAPTGGARFVVSLPLRGPESSL